MKIPYSIILLFFTLSLLSCKGEDEGTSLDSSAKDWEETKSKEGNNYSYQVVSQSWTGYGTSTTLKVVDGQVSEREYTAYQIEEGGDRVILSEYSESMDSLGSHDEGAGIYTIDELYDQCEGEYLSVDAAKNTIYFSTFKNGLLQTCGYVPSNCMDDCFVGFKISLIAFEE